MPTWEEIKAVLWEWTRTHGLRIAVALIILFISFRLVNLISRIILRRSEKKNKQSISIPYALSCYKRQRQQGCPGKESPKDTSWDDPIIDFYFQQCD